MAAEKEVSYIERGVESRKLTERTWIKITKLQENIFWPLAVIHSVICKYPTFENALYCWVTMQSSMLKESNIRKFF
jgi:hypothetical protein